MPSTERLARDLANLRHEVKSLATTPRLSRSSIDGGSLEIRDVEGNTTGYVGEQFDGTFTVAPVGGSYPSSPTMPMVTPIQGGLRIYWDGTYDDDSVTRMDFRRVTFHAVPDGDELDMLSPIQIVGEISIATGGEVIASLPPVEHLVYAVTWTDAGKFSPESEPAFGTPLTLIDDEDFQGVQAEVAAATEAAANAPEVFREGTQPSVPADKKAIWFDTSNGNVPHYFDGAAWSQMPMGQGALSADAVVAETIAAGALDGQVITGSLIQTLAALDEGIKIVDNSLLAYDGAGDPVFLLDGDTGSISMSGPAISDAAITGSVLRTAQSGRRVQIGDWTGYGGTGESGSLQFFSGVSGEMEPATLATGAFGSGSTADAFLYLSAPKFSATDEVGSIYMTRRSDGTGAIELDGTEILGTGGRQILLSTEQPVGVGTGATLVYLNDSSIMLRTSDDGTPSFSADGPCSIEIDGPGLIQLESTDDDIVLRAQAASKGVRIDGDLYHKSGSAQHKVPRFATNVVTLGAGAVSHVVTFPSGRFASAPIVTTTMTAEANVAIVANVYDVTATGFTAYFYPVGGGTWTVGNARMHWHAIETV